MNPETNRFEKLYVAKPKITDDSIKKLHEQLNEATASLLIRPNGTPVPKTWTVFTVGELVTIKNYSFRVAHIGESHILFEPVSAEEITLNDSHNLDE